MEGFMDAAASTTSTFHAVGCDCETLRHDPLKPLAITSLLFLLSRT